MTQPPVQPPIQPPAQPPGQPPAGPPPVSPPAGLPPTGPPRPPAASFNTSKLVTIGAIVGGVVLAGVIGGVVALALGGGDDDSTAAGGSSTNSGILDPKPVGSVDAPTQPEEDPSTEPADPSEEPTEAPADEPAAGGDTVDVGGVRIALPDGWSAMGDVGSDSAAFTDEAGSWVYVLTGAVKPTTDAAGLINSNLDYFIGSENYSQVQVGELTPLDPFGSLVSGAMVDYSATWVDSQGSMPLHGRIYAGVRQDGTALIMSAEHAPPDDFESSYQAWGQVVEGTFNLFAGS